MKATLAGCSAFSIQVLNSYAPTSSHHRRWRDLSIGIGVRTFWDNLLEEKSA